MPDLFQQPDDDARTLARSILTHARFGALGVHKDGAPFVTRIAVAPGEPGELLTLISDLAPHTAALRTAPRASLLVGEPKDKGDPLAFPRLSLDVSAEFSEKSEEMRAAYLRHQPKAKLYIDFGDFHIVRLKMSGALLNGGFGRAYKMEVSDLI